MKKWNSPGEMLRHFLDLKGWTREELSTITGKSRNTILAIASDRSGITPDVAVALSAAFGNEPQEWLKVDAEYRLLKVKQNGNEVEKRARLFEIAPIRDIQRRGWINETTNVDGLESELKRFFGTDSLDNIPDLSVAPRRTIKLPTLNPAERAWCFRARHLANNIMVSEFSEKKLDAAERKLKRLAAYRKETRHIAKTLSDAGIRFVVIEPIPTVKIDGAAFWINKEPVIALSLRYDRIDAFWFTLMHEIAHIRNGDASVDPDLIDGIKGIAVTLEDDENEQFANEYATNSLVPQDEIQSFIRRVGPFYAKERIVQFAHKVKIHPGIIVGQLQHRNEIGYSALREFLVKVRDIVISTTLTDGWNQIPGTL
ncbi:MAG: helix-turn-helix domain-containing protein [Acidobacteria bacterium]|nr:helix-turn-helix domain-containing protein [Acidobacteriota bacterium]